MYKLTLLFLSLITLTGAVPSLAADGSVTTLAEWNFDSPGDLAGWTVSSNVEGLAVRDGCLVGRSTGRDPSVAGPTIDIPASPYQYVEIRMRTSASGTGELFWTNTSDDPYGGFRSSLVQRISYTSGDFRTYRVFPFWQDLGKVIRLRIDPPEDADFAVDYIKVVEVTTPASKKAFFDFTKPDDLWMSISDPQPTASTEGIALSPAGESAIVSPKLDLDAAMLPWLNVMLKSNGVDHCVLRWVTDVLPGACSYTLPIKPDGDWHVYNIRTEGVRDWVGRIRVMSVSASLDENKRLGVRFAGASIKPMGPAALEIRDFGFRDPVNRVGAKTPAVLQAEVVNIGGEPIRDEITVHLRISPDVKTKISAQSVPSAVGLKPGEKKTIILDAVPETAGVSQVVMTVSNKEAVATAAATLVWYPTLAPKTATYVPEPQPVRGEFEVGMYYYPGWRGYSSWSVLDGFPERRPLLGYYREGEPEIADWQIKWMVEHGVTFIVYDWYWSAGGRSLDHALHQGYFNAKYHDQIKFCLLWANHNAPGTSSAEDMVNVTNYWLDNYFLRPDYFKVDGKPVVVIFSAGRLTEDLGADGVRQAFDKSREMAKARGLSGIYFVGCTYPGQANIKILEQEGYDALTGYNYPSAGDKGQIRAPYEDMVTGYQEFWNAIADSTTLRYIPVTEPGWDSRPWHGVNARVRTDKSPALFQKMLENAKSFVEQRDPAAEPKIVLVEAWNEFGEGDYVEPHKEFGFGYLDAIRDTFTSAPKEHDDITPQDVGLGPYDLEKPKPATAWEFDDPKSPGWSAAMNLGNMTIENSAMTDTSIGNDPAFVAAVEMDASKLRYVEIRMKVNKGRGAQLFWSNTGSTFAEEASIRFDLNSDGAYHVYKLKLTDSPLWRSRIAALRLDPTDAAGAEISIDYIRFVR